MKIETKFDIDDMVVLPSGNTGKIVDIVIKNVTDPDHFTYEVIMSDNNQHVCAYQYELSSPKIYPSVYNEPHDYGKLSYADNESVIIAPAAHVGRFRDLERIAYLSNLLRLKPSISYMPINTELTNLLNKMIIYHGNHNMIFLNKANLSPGGK